MVAGSRHSRHRSADRADRGLAIVAAREHRRVASTGCLAHRATGGQGQQGEQAQQLRPEAVRRHGGSFTTSWASSFTWVVHLVRRSLDGVLGTFDFADSNPGTRRILCSSGNLGYLATAVSSLVAVVTWSGSARL